MPRILTTVLSLLCLLATSAESAETPADVLKQFYADMQAKRADAVKTRIFVLKGDHPEAGEEQVEQMLQEVRNGEMPQMTIKVLDSLVQDDTAIVACQFQSPGRRTELEPSYLVLEKGKWQLIPAVDHLERIDNLSEARKKRLATLRQWYEKRKPEWEQNDEAEPDAKAEAQVSRNSALVLAAAFGKLDDAKRLIEQGADVNGFGRTRSTPIEAAAESNHLDMIRLLVSKGAKVDPPGPSLLPQIIEWSKPETALLLIELGADVNRSSRGKTPLLAAAGRGNADLVKVLLEKKANSRPELLNPNALLMAALSSGDAKTFDLVKPLYPNLRVTDRYGDNPLHVAAMGGYTRPDVDPEIVRALLRAGVDPHAVSPDRRLDKGINTPLRIAALCGRSNMVEVLLDEAKFDPAELTDALVFATRSCRTSIVEKLLKAGASPMAKDDFGHMPLHNAVSRRDAAMVKLLLDHKAPIDARTQPLGRTPLLDAVASSTPEIVAELLKRGADPKLKDKDGNDAAALARIRLTRGQEFKPAKDYMPEYPKSPNHGKDIAKLLGVPTPQANPANIAPGTPAATPAPSR